MKALIFDKSKYKWETSRGFDLVDAPKPKIQNPDDVIIKVHYAGVCGSDKGIWYRTAFRDQILNSIDAESNPLNPPYPKGEVTPLKVRGAGGVMIQKTYRIIGHEFFGEIVELGSEAAKKFKLKKGDFVSCESHVVCNQCYQCLRGEKHVCTNEKILGISHDGGFAQYVKVPGHIVWKTDTSKIRPEVAAVQEPFGNAVHAASKVDLKGKTVAIFGLGPIGLFLLLIAKGMGAKEIIGVEPNPIAIEMAKKLGIDYVIQLNKFNSQTHADLTRTNADNHPHPARLASESVAGRPTSPIKGEEKSGINSPPLVGGARGGGYQHSPEVTDEIMRITGGVGADVSFEMAGFNNSFNNAIFATRRGGEVILFGIKTGDFVLEDYNRLIVRGLTMHAVIGRQIWETWETTRSLLENPKNKIQEQIYKVILNEGKGTILPVSQYSKEKFEKLITEHPKFLIQF